jgi:hypothetical protein
MKEEDKISINNYLKSKDIKNNNILIVKDYSEYKMMSKKSLLTIPDITFFDGNGDLIEYKNTQKECSKDAYFFIKDYTKEKNLKLDKTKKMDDYISSFRNLNNDLSIDTSDKSKIYVFINWAIFTDKINKDSFDLLSLKNENFTYILVNLDTQKNWNVSEKKI